MTMSSDFSSGDASERGNDVNTSPEKPGTVVGHLVLDAETQNAATTAKSSYAENNRVNTDMKTIFPSSLAKELSASANVPNTPTNEVLPSVLSSDGAGIGGWSAGVSSGSEEEDYDKLKFDSSALVGGCKGGGIEKQGLIRDGISGSMVNIGSDRKLKRRKSIQITLEKTSRRGQYVLKADDPEIRDILRAGIQREAEEAALGLNKHGGQRKRKSRFRDLVFTRQFTTFDRQNPLSAQSPFHGFFTLFWLICAALLIRVAAHNQRTHGSVFGGNELMHMMFDRDVVVMGLTDGVMCASTAVGLALQKAIVKGYLSWNGAGWIIQSLWQMAYLSVIVWWTFHREWPWTHTIFIVLHAMVFLMKQHSYAFYNGYLSQVYRRKAILQKKLEQLDEIDPLVSPTLPHSKSSPILATGFQKPTQSESQPSPPSSHSKTLGSSPTTHPLTHRRKSTTIKACTNLASEETEISRIARAIESEEPLDTDQLDAFKSIIATEIEQLDEDLRGKSTSSANYYPRNLTAANFADWTFLPTVVYELEYPRQERRNWWYIAEKTAATFGVIWVMMVISQAYIYPPVSRAVRMRDAGLPLHRRSRELPWTVIDMLLPLLLEQLLSWYVIWECLLNVLAELTLFADRGFYGDWWNSVSWDQYARDWNRPVHNFLLRHVYHSSISALRLSKLEATFVTFLLSAFVHELVMFVLFKRVRGYLFAMQLLQVPMVMLSRTGWLKGRDGLGNVVFWIGMFVGPSLLTALYLIV